MASSTAFSSAISPREEFSSVALGFSLARNLGSIIESLWGFRGRCRVTTSEQLSSSSSSTKPLSPLAARGGSHLLSVMPRSSAIFSTSRPTLPTPIIPSVRCLGSIMFLFASSRSTAKTHCATALALHPVADFTVMPLVAQYSLSMWSVPMVAVAINSSALPSNSSLLQRVRLLVISAVALASSLESI